MPRIISPEFALAIGIYATLLGTLLDDALQPHPFARGSPLSSIPVLTAASTLGVGNDPGDLRRRIRRLDLKESLSVASERPRV
jgi:hypothetical protein